MFNIKQFVNRITDNRNERDGPGETSAAFVDNEEQHSAEGFLCPPCMKAFPSPEALEEHYKKTHENEGASPDSNSNSNGDTQILRHEIQLLQDSLAEEKANSEELKKEMLKLQADLNAKEFDATSLRSQEKELEDSKTFLTSEVTLLRQQLADSLKQISILRKEKEGVATKAESSSTEVEELKKEITSLQTQLSHRNSVDDAEVLRQELVSVQKLMDQMALEKEKEIETLNNKLNEMQPSVPSGQLEEQLSQALSELVVLKTRNEDIERQSKEVLKSHADQLLQKDAKISELESSSQTSTKKIEIMNQECDQLKEECGRLREQHAELCSKIETGEGAKAALEGLQQENAIMKKSLDEAQEKSRELSKQNHDIGLQLEKSVAEATVTQTELAKQQKEYNELKTKVETTSKAQQKAIDDLTKANQKSSTQLKQNESELKTLKDEKMRLGEQLKKLEGVCETFKTKEAEQQKSIESKSAKIELLEKTVESTNASLTTVKKNLQATKEELLTAQGSINDLQKSLTNKTTELKQMEENYENQLKSVTLLLTEKDSELEEKSKELLDVKKTLEEEASSLRSKVESLESEIRQKNSDLEEKSKKAKELTEQRNEKEQNLQLLQSKVDEMIQHKLQLEQICESNEEEKSQLLEKLISNESEAKTLNVTIEELTRKRDDAMAALQELGRENQSLQVEMAKIQGRKWADDSNVPNCSSCTKDFTLTFRKHHCRHCGQIFCSDCSSKSASVPSSKKPVRVCDGCFVKLTTQ